MHVGISLHVDPFDFQCHICSHFSVCLVFLFYANCVPWSVTQWTGTMQSFPVHHTFVRKACYLVNTLLSFVFIYSVFRHANINSKGGLQCFSSGPPAVLTTALQGGRIGRE